MEYYATIGGMLLLKIFLEYMVLSDNGNMLGYNDVELQFFSRLAEEVRNDVK